MLDDVIMYQMFHFLMSCLKSGRSSILLDIIVRLINPVLSLQVMYLLSVAFGFSQNLSVR